MAIFDSELLFRPTFSIIVQSAPFRFFCELSPRYFTSHERGGKFYGQVEDAAGRSLGPLTQSRPHAARVPRASASPCLRDDGVSDGPIIKAN